MGRRDRDRKGSFWLGHPQVQTGSRLVPFSDRLLTSVLRSGCADPVRAQVPRTRPVCRAESKAESPPSETKPCLPIPCESFAGRATRVRPCSPPLPPGPDPPSTRAVLAAPLGVTRDTRKGRTRAPLLTPRSARRTGHSHNTHSGSSLSSSSLRGDDLHTVDTTDQVPGVGGGAPRCYPQTPSPAPGNSWHGSDAGSNTTPSTSIQYNHRTALLPVVLLPSVGLVRDPLTHTGGRVGAA